MNIQYIKKMVRVLLPICVLAFCLSCSKWDEFKEYIDEGEITYVGKPDSVRILSGNERVKIRAILKPDPKISEVRVFWNDGKDSVGVPLDAAMKESRVFEYVLPMPEGIVSLALVTYDELGNRSVVVPVVGRSFGSRYQNGLNNRLIGNAVLNNGQAVIDWLEMDLSAGPFATEIKYKSTTGQEKVVRVPLASMQTIVTDIQETAKTVDYRTLFLPQSTSIDTFATAYRTIGLARDVTAQYLKNTAVPIETTQRSDRWGIPAHWQTNVAVRNFKDANGHYFGGVDYWFNGPFLAMEAGWSADNMASITNGKIYQQVNLPAGFYTFEMDIPDCTAGGEFYTVAAEGDGLPNGSDVGGALAFLKTNTVGTHKLSFTLAQSTTVSLGFVGTLPNKGAGDGTFWRITAVRLKQTLLVE